MVLFGLPIDRDQIVAGIIFAVLVWIISRPLRIAIVKTYFTVKRIIRWLSKLRRPRRPSASQVKNTDERVRYERSLMTARLRAYILHRDNYTCVHCGRRAADGVKLCIDHIVPVSRGGRTVEENLQVLCEQCNLGKSNRFND